MLMGRVSEGQHPSEVGVRAPGFASIELSAHPFQAIKQPVSIVDIAGFILPEPSEYKLCQGYKQGCIVTE